MHVYDIKPKYILGIKDHFLMLGTRDVRPEIGRTLITIDICEKGVSVSTMGDVNESAVLVAQAHCEMIRRDMLEILNIPIQEKQRFSELIGTYNDIGVDTPTAKAYSDLQDMLRKKHDITLDRDKDVT